MGISSSGPTRAGLADLWLSFRQVLLSPTLGFYRLAEGGSLLPPLLLATLCGALAGGMDSLKAAVIAVLGGGHLGTAWVTWTVVLFLALAPLHYAGLVAIYAAIGTVVAGRTAGIGFKAAFRRTWASLGWINLPVALATLAVLIWAATLGRSTLGPVWEDMAAAVEAGFAPSFTFDVGMFLGLGLLVWTAALLVVAVRQVFSTDTFRAILIIVLTGLVVGMLVHTPISRWVFANVADTDGVLGREENPFGRPATVGVSLVAYRLPWSNRPQAGDLVAISSVETGFERPRFVLETGGGTIAFGRFQVGLTRVVALPGDRVEVRQGFLYVNGELAAEPYLSGADPARAHPEGLSVAETVVPPDSYFVLPDDRALVLERPSRFETIVQRRLIVGRVVVRHVLGGAESGG